MEHSSYGQTDYDIRPPAPRWRVYSFVTLVVALIAGLIFAASGAFSSANASAVTAADCAEALGFPDRDAADQVWLQQCVHALRPYVAPTTASPTGEPTTVPPTTTPPSPSASPTVPTETATWTTSGRNLKDPRGVTFVPRGAEQVMWNASWLPNSHITQQANCGSNTIRILPYFTRNTPTGEPKNTIAQIEDQIRRGINGKVLVDIAIDGGQDSPNGSNPYLRTDVKTMLLKYQKYIVIHAKGEADESNGAQWVMNANARVAAMRAAGYTAPLYIMTTTAGRNLPVALNFGQQIVDADPLHRIVIGWQAYWGPNNFYQGQYGMTLAQAFTAVRNANFPIQVGLIKRADIQDGNQAAMNYSALMADAQSGATPENRIGWMWWDWRMGADDLTTNGNCGSYAHDGLDIVVNNTNGIQKTAVRTPFMLAQVAPV